MSLVIFPTKTGVQTLVWTSKINLGLHIIKEIILINLLKITQLVFIIVSLLIPPSALAAGKHALLIGIQNYDETPSFKSIKGPANDIKLTKGVLRQRFGFAEKDFLILLDQQATHTGIEKAFLSLIERVQTNDFVYIYYSGHGSQTADLNGDEPSGKDQTWVSYGARRSTAQHKDNYDVLDDEVNAWLAALYAKTERVIFVSDSCHSATVSRSVSQGEALIRAGKEDKRPHLLGKLNYSRPTIYHGIRVGAAQDDESAIDFEHENGQHYGLFTWYWVHNLQQAQAGYSWKRVFNWTYVQVKLKRDLVQRPYLEGTLSQQVLGSDFTPLPKTVPVSLFIEERVRLPIGFLAGVTEGSVYRLYKHSNEPNLARLTIREVSPFESLAEPEGAFQEGDLVIEESHAHHFSSIKVYLEADFSSDQPLLQQIQALFHQQRIPAYELTDEPSQADLRLYLLRPKWENGQFIRARAEDALPKSFANQAPQLWVLTPEQRLLDKQLQIQFDNPNKGLELLVNNLNKLVRVRELKELQSSDGGTVPVTVQTSVWHSVKVCPKGATCVHFDSEWWQEMKRYNKLSSLEKHTFSKGEVISFNLHNQSQTDYYFYLINISPDGAIHPLFPNPSEPMGFALLKAGEKREVASSLRMRVVGEETLKVIISPHPIDVSLLEQSKFRQRIGLNPLEQLLDNAMRGRRQRTSIGIGDWATVQVMFEVE
jgi:hypothetical protein